MPAPMSAAEVAERIATALPATKVTYPVIDRVPKGANFFLYLMDMNEECSLVLCVERGFLGDRAGPTSDRPGTAGHPRGGRRRLHPDPVRAGPAPSHRRHLTTA